MSIVICNQQLPDRPIDTSIQTEVDSIIDDLLISLPDPNSLSSEQRRGIISRYTAVLEGNFIYWMTASYLSARAPEARPILLENLHEEVRDSHPVMLRKFALAAHAFPSDLDALAVHHDLTNVRLFLGRLSGVRTILMMAFFEGFIQRFMIYLAELAAQQGSAEQEYTSVHGVCDVAHTQQLFCALAAEMALCSTEASTDLFEGVDLLRALIQSIIRPQ
jgi:hypothetical protein